MVVEIAPLIIPGVPGGPELLIILFIAILLFGANKIPKLARSTGEAMGEFKKGQEKVEAELEEMRETGYKEVTEEDEDEDEDFVETDHVASEESTETETETETN